jgi:hypothetical protein
MKLDIDSGLEDFARVKLCEWDRWRRGEGVSIGSPQSWAELDIAIADLQRDNFRLNVIPVSAELTHRVLTEMKKQRQEQVNALTLYHLTDTNLLRIAKRVHIKRDRVADVLRLAHDNFKALRGVLATPRQC